MSSILRELGGIISPTATKHKRVIFIGTRGSSKTTGLGCLALTCDLLSTRDRKFKHFIDEKTSGIRQVPSDLCAGYFPEPTPPGLLYEADMYLTWTGTLNEKSVVLPFCETAGEDMESLIGPYQKSVYQQSVNWQAADNLNKYICDSNGYVLVVPVNRAHIPGIPKDFLESEPENLRWDPDVNLARILSAVYRYKKQVRSAPIEGIAVLLTKYDTVDAYCKSKGMDLYDPVGAQLFLETYFRQTSALLKYYGINKVRFFPVHVQVEKVQKSDGTVTLAKYSEGKGYKIVLDHDRNLPVYSEQSYYNLIEWIKETFAK